MTLSRKSIGQYALVVILIMLWQLIYQVIGAPAMASPWESIVNLVENFIPWLSDINSTLIALLISFVLAAVIGVILGFLIGLSSFWTQVFGPIILGIYSIPKITLYPIFLLVFGLTIEGRIAFSFFHGVFPIIIVCMEATRTVPTVYLKLSKTYRLTFLEKARFILIPSILPQLVSGLRMGFNLCFLGLIISEMFASYEGLGSRLMKYLSLENTPSIFSLFLIISFIALFVTFLFLLWEQKKEERIGRFEN